MRISNILQLTRFCHNLNSLNKATLMRVSSWRASVCWYILTFRMLLLSNPYFPGNSYQLTVKYIVNFKKWLVLNHLYGYNASGWRRRNINITFDITMAWIVRCIVVRMVYCNLWDFVANKSIWIRYKYHLRVSLTIFISSLIAPVRALLYLLGFSIIISSYNLKTKTF